MYFTEHCFSFFFLLVFLLKLEYDILIYLHKFPLKSQVAFICLSRPTEGNEFPRAEAHLDANLCACRCAFRVRVCCHSFSGATWSIGNDYGFMVSTCGTASNSLSEFRFSQSLSETSKLFRRKIMHFSLKHDFFLQLCLFDSTGFFSKHPETIQNPSNSSFLSRSRLCDAPLAKSAKKTRWLFPSKILELPMSGPGFLAQRRALGGMQRLIPKNTARDEVW